MTTRAAFGGGPGTARSWTRRWTAAATVAAALVLPVLAAGPASAHVTAVAPDAAPGGYTVVTLRVPTESATAGTVGLEIDLPDDHPLAVVRAQTTPGWTATLQQAHLATPIDNGHGKKIDQAVTSVAFTAREGVSVPPGEFAEFRLLVGPFPASGVLTLPTRQLYSDGTVAAWIEQSHDGTEADRPAPQIRLTGSGHGDEHEHPAAAAASGSGGWTGPAALAASLAALALAGFAILRGRRVGRAA
ncbi:YcnI family protein [Nocardia thailandica]